MTAAEAEMAVFRPLEHHRRRARKGHFCPSTKLSAPCSNVMHKEARLPRAISAYSQDSVSSLGQRRSFRSPSLAALSEARCERQRSDLSGLRDLRPSRVANAAGTLRDFLASSGWRRRSAAPDASDYSLMVSKSPRDATQLETESRPCI